VEKYCRAGQARNYNVTVGHCMLDAKGYKHALTICNTWFVFDAAVVAQMQFNVVLCIHCFSWLL
jgi:hypothetical protein